MLPPRTPDLAALDLLLAVAETGSVGRAAALHGVSQPSASTRLARLERRVGVALLVRTRRGSTLTPAGEAVATWAREVVDAAHRLTDGVQALRADRSVRLRVCASLTIAEYLMPPWLLALRRAHPSLDVGVAVANSAEVCRQVITGVVDVGFVEAPSVPAGLNALRVGTDRLAIVVAPRYPLASRAGAVAARELADQPLLLREPGSGTRDTFLHALHRALGAVPVLAHATELGSTTTLLATARAAGGLAVVSARAAAADLGSGALVELAVPDLDLERPLHAIWLGARPTDLAHELVRLARAASGEPAGGAIPRPRQRSAR
ncbi:MAG: LysR family transcriptional regulator [Jatrophihabitans sp.]|nr:MAG: LysR family transcriptional regulator [Jatrophihabitans sp.]